MEHNDENRIEIDLSDLDEDLETSPEPSNRLVITNEDLTDIDDTPPCTPIGSEVIGGCVPGDYASACTSKAGAFSAATLMQNLAAGVIGGFAAWLITEAGYDESSRTTANILVEMGIFGGMIGAAIGITLGAVESILNRLAERAFIGAAIGMAAGFGGGFLGGIVGQAVYAALGGGHQASFDQQILARAIGWGIVGAFVGLGPGIAIRSTQKTINALIGGTVGGIVGGGLFDIIGLAVDGGSISRAFAITALGACAGVAIGIVEEMRKQAWLTVMHGPLSGKQFIIYKDITTIGSSAKCDIPLFKDPDIMPQHAIIRQENGRYGIRSAQSNSPVYLNRQALTHKILRNGDTIAIGKTVFIYNEKLHIANYGR